MQSKFYTPGDQRAVQVRHLFTTIARRYDLLNDLMSAGLHRRWKRRLVRMAGQPDRVLDLCCGTGDLALRCRAHVFGVDFSEEMLRVAQTRVAGATSLSRPVWVRADALRLPFPADSFGAVTVGYGLRNLADLQAGLREILRVLRPGGRFLSLDFGKPASPTLRRAYFGYLRAVVPALARLVGSDPEGYTYILASLEDYPAQRGVRDLMQAVGFGACDFVELLGGAMAINHGQKPAA